MGLHPSNYHFISREYIFLIYVSIISSKYVSLTYQKYMLFVSIQGDELLPSGRLVGTK